MKPESFLIIGGAIIVIMLLIAVTSEAKADCYVQRWSYSTSYSCDDGENVIVNEDNTRNRYGRRDHMPSLRRDPPAIYQDRSGSYYCSQTGSIYSCR